MSQGRFDFQVHLQGEEVVVVRGDGHRRTWRDVIALVDEEGKRTVLAVGDSRASLERGATSAERGALERALFRSALAPAAFDPEIAAAYLRYVIYVSTRPRPWWRRFRRPTLALHLPGYAEVPDAVRRVFESGLRSSWRRCRLNGRQV